MKNKTILIGMMVAAICAFTLVQSKAQTFDPLGVKILPTDRQDMIKVIYANDNNSEVEIKFHDASGLIKKDKIEANSFEKGFAKKYKVKRQPADEFWLEVNNPEMTAIYKMKTNKDGKWIAELEQTTSHKMVASNNR
jgi:hypothetical protein